MPNTFRDLEIARAYEALGYKTCRAADEYWLAYRRALIPLEPLPIDLGRFSGAQLDLALLRTGCLFSRWQGAPSSVPTEWWHVVCRKYELGALSRNARSQVRRGCKRHEIRPLHHTDLRALGYGCHVSAYTRYSNARPLSRSDFETFVDIWAACDSAQFIGAFSCDGELVGYILCLQSERSVFMHTVDITPAGLSQYASAALVHSVLERFVAGEGLVVCNGTRSISHETSMQEYLLRFGFKREYSLLRVRYRPVMGTLVSAVYPLRTLLLFLPSSVAVFRDLNSLVLQESIARNEQIPPTLYLGWLKPILDRVLGLFGLALVSPVLVLLALLVYQNDGAPVLFSQVRIGQHGRPFRLFKFRSMSVGGSKEGSVTVAGDRRVTRLGRFLRRWKLDELPQLLNVVKGEMSFVGPRPDVPGFADLLEGPDRIVLALKPGITGPASLFYRNEEEILSAVDDPIVFNDRVIFPRKVEMNREYVSSASPWLDLTIVLRTLFGKGQVSPPAGSGEPSS